MRSVGTALIVLLAVTGCTAAEPASSLSSNGSGAAEQPAEGAASENPEESDFGRVGDPASAPPQAVDAELRTAIAVADALDEARQLVTDGRLDEARAVVDGSLAAHVPVAGAEWAEEFEALQRDSNIYLQLFDVDSPETAEIDAWVAQVTADLAAFREASGLQPIQEYSDLDR